jgi:hypothetical protein
MTARIYFNGVPTDEVVVSGTLFASGVSVTSTFDDPLPVNGQRPYIVAFERYTNNGDICAVVCTHGRTEGFANISEQEDFDVSLRQGAPSIVTDGTSFLLAYTELSFASGIPDDYDVYMVSGSLTHLASGTTLALAERHVPVAASNSPEEAPWIASRFDGGGGTDDGVVVWERRDHPTGAQLLFQTLDVYTLEGSDQQARGRQYCQAYAHGDSGALGRLSSWTGCGATSRSALRIGCTAWT